MRRNIVLLCAACAGCALAILPLGAASQALPGAGADGRGVAAGSGSAAALVPALDSIAAGLATIERSAASGRLPEARQQALRLYLDRYEILESEYGAGSGGPPQLAAAIGSIEGTFHELLRAEDAGTAASLAVGLRGRVLALRPLAAAMAVPAARALSRRATAGPAVVSVAEQAVRSPEVRTILSGLDRAESSYRAGRVAEALSVVERLYLDDVEPLEPRLPQREVHQLERLVHLGVRARLAAGASRAEVEGSFSALRAELVQVDALLSGGSPTWLGATNAFVIIVREGLEAVLLIAALLAYLSAAGAGSRERRRIYLGAGAGVVATGVTWLVARLVIPIGGASRELVEGITGLVAVGVLVYVSNWLFQKTYIHDWKDYLRERVGAAVTAGSGLAMAALAFAAVYREGFETVLFYQALLFDAGPRAVLAGAVPGALAIGALGVGIIRLGVKLPLRRVFAVTNAILLCLAFSFVGKGLYNLQEAGIFAPHPLALPDWPVARELLGIYPIAETLAAQLVFAGGVLLTYLYHRRMLRRKVALSTAARTRAPSGIAATGS